MNMVSSFVTTYDPDADAAYATVGSGAIERTVEVGGGLLVDLDAQGRPVGVEVLSVSGRVGAGDRTSYLQGLVEGVLSGIRQAAE